MIRELQVQGVFSENTYFYIDPLTASGFIIDPGAQPDLILDAVLSNRWSIERILLTHGHFDHMGAASFLSKRLNAPIFIHHADSRYMSDTRLNLSFNSPEPFTIDHYEELNDDQIIRLSSNQRFYLKVIHTPGHTPGSVTYYSPEDKAAFVGDLLYQHGPGLTHFPGGNPRLLEQSIINKILTLPPDTILLSGHSAPITVQQQRALLL